MFKRSKFIIVFLVSIIIITSAQSQSKFCFLNHQCYNLKQGLIKTDTTNYGIIKVLLVNDDSCLFWFKDMKNKQIIEGSYSIQGTTIDSVFVENEYGDIIFQGIDTSANMIQCSDWKYYNFNGKNKNRH